MQNSVPPFFISGSASSHADEGPAGHVHGLQEAGARAVGDAAVQVLARREGDGMQHEVQRAPFALQALEHRFQFAFVQQVQRHQHVGPHLLGQRLDVGQGLVVQVGHGQFGAHGVKGLSAAQAMESALAMPVTRPRLPASGSQCVHRCFTSASVCWAMISSSLVRTTYTPMRLSSLEMQGPWWALRSGSSLMPSQPQCSLMAWRMAGNSRPRRR